MPKTVGVCLIGAGRAGAVHGKNFSQHIAGSKVVAVVDSYAENAMKAAKDFGAEKWYTNHKEALKQEDVDAVVISTPTFTHAEIAIDAAEAGKHIFCEKPMALTLKEADEMISAARRAGVKLQMGFMRRFDPEFQTAKRMIEEGVIGKLAIVKSTGRGPTLPPPWACDPKTSIGMLAEVNSHDFDTVRWLMGSDIKKVYAEAEAIAVPELKDKYPNFYDNAVVTLRFANGSLGLIDGACPVKYGYDARVEILGTEGVMLIGELKHQAVVVCKKETGVYTSTFPSWRNRFKEAYLEEAKHFIDCIINDKKPIASGDDGKAALEAALAATKSIIEGKPVTLPLTSFP
ncbi:MAG: Gfo/Idh/MocA family oxidoreductase [Candidatus Bathyarchaeota archaeon]|nr:Gfo/Idh/MocA family oxidoreductase [Candidatus Bathyarchaeota archaeon]